MINNRRTFKWRMRLAIGGWLQSLAWRLTDSHDHWMISWHDADGRVYASVFAMHHDLARAKARELKGRIDGVCRGVIEAEIDGPPRDDADWWKRGGGR